MIAFFKHLHMTMALLTFVGFFLRGIWMLRQSPLLERRWVKIVPHAIDTLLLVSAVVLASLLSYAPWVHPWLMAKIGALVLYIILGTLAFKHPSLAVRTGSWLAALTVFLYIVSVALNKSPWGFLLLWFQ